MIRMLWNREEYKYQERSELPTMVEDLSTVIIDAYEADFC